MSGKTAWVVNKDQTLTKADVLRARPYKVMDRTGYGLSLKTADGDFVELDTMLPNGNMFPAVYYQDKKPDLWFYKGRSLPIRDLDAENFSEDPEEDEFLRTWAKANVPSPEPYKFLPHTESFIDGIIQKKPMFLVGKKGTGKSSLIEQVCARTNWPYYRVNVTQIIVADLVGNILIEGGATVWKDGSLTLCSRVGAMFNGDEFDSLQPDLSFFFFPVLEQPPKLTLKEKPDCEVMKFHQWFRFIATGNVMGQEDAEEYVGTQPLNAALKSRFAAGKILEIQQMSTTQERAVIAKRVPWASMNIIKRCSQMADSIRNSVYPTLDTRELMSWVENVILKRDYLEAAKESWLPIVKRSNRKDAENLISKSARRVVIGRSAMSFESKPGMPLQSATSLPQKINMGKATPATIDNPAWEKAIYDAKEGFNLSFSAIEQHFNIRERNGNNARDIWKRHKKRVKVPA